MNQTTRELVEEFVAAAATLARLEGELGRPDLSLCEGPFVVLEPGEAPAFSIRWIGLADSAWRERERMRFQRGMRMSPVTRQLRPPDVEDTNPEEWRWKRISPPSSLAEPVYVEAGAPGRQFHGEVAERLVVAVLEPEDVEPARLRMPDLILVLSPLPALAQVELERPLANPIARFYARQQGRTPGEVLDLAREFAAWLIARRKQAAAA